MSEETENEDLRTQRASSYALAGIKCEVTAVSKLTAKDVPTAGRALQSFIKRLRTVTELLDYLQEDPQLLDPLLKELLPPLTDTFINLCTQGFTTQFAFIPLQSLAEVLCAFCKVRGSKVIVQFLDNEARYIHPMLQSIEAATEEPSGEGESKTEDPTLITHLSPVASQSAGGKWQLRYILQLWIGHLMLTPFDLSTISSDESVQPHDVDLDLPRELPSIAHRVVRMAYRYLSSPTKEQVSAASALVTLAIRPDMRKIGLLDCLVTHALSKLSPTEAIEISIYAANGYLLFINGLLRSATLDDVYQYLEAIFDRILAISSASSTSYETLRKSATTKKLLIKIQRHLMVHLLQSTPRNSIGSQAVVKLILENNSGLEETIDSLLTLLADRETPVRYAASKALSVITSKMSSELAEQIVDAVLGSLKEDVREVDHGISKHSDVSSVDAARWHGLTLTLAHMLFRQSPSSKQLPEVLDALYSSLTFEQRAATGNSLGVNVRDAANFGLWSLSRRYSTEHLSALDKGAESSPPSSTLQQVATELLVAACLDSAGNVRRGSSAALQELIGRHPSTIQEGIPIVQIVDYHAVGLRRRAMIDVAFDAAQLDSSYLRGLWDGLLGWRGIQAPDIVSRNFAALSLGRLSSLLPASEVEAHVRTIRELLTTLPPREVEWRHGLIKSLAAIVLQFAVNTQLEIDCSKQIADCWDLFEGPLALNPKDMSRASMRPDLATSATVELITAVCTLALKNLAESQGIPHISSGQPTQRSLDTLTICLKTSDQSTVDAIPWACIKVALLIEAQQRHELLEIWETELRHCAMTPRRSGYMTALAALSYSGRITAPGEGSMKVADLIEDKVVTMLVENFTKHEDVDARVTALRCIALAIHGPLSERPDELDDPLPERFNKFLPGVLERGLDDYTINERGDVGSLVRIEAMATLHSLGRVDPSAWRRCVIAVERMTLERLDKVRSQAAHTLQKFEVATEMGADVSSYEYFLYAIHRMLQLSPKRNEAGKETDAELRLHSFLTGISSSTGQGSESLMQTARSALWTALDTLPVYPETTHAPSLYTVMNSLLTLLSASLTNDRTLLPLLENLAFLFDTGISDRLTSTPSNPQNSDTRPFKFLTLLSLVQKAHFKSTSLPKLLVCVQIYRGLASLQGPSRTSPELARVKQETLKKLTSMLLHPFAKVRTAVVEVVWVAVTDMGSSVGEAGSLQETRAAEALERVDWSTGGAEADERRKKAVKIVREALGV